MSEVQSRPSGTRGRGGYRGGRGGYRGTRVSSKSHTKSDDQENFPSEPEDQGEVGELKKKYGDRVSALRELCEGWSDEDLVYALKETNGDANMAFDRISGGTSIEIQAPLLYLQALGTISQWGEVGKKKPKAKEASAAVGGRGGRGRGAGESRGRGRGTERTSAGRGARSGTQTNGTKTITTAAADDGWGEPPAATSWDTPTNGAVETPAAAAWTDETVTETPAAAVRSENTDAHASVKSKVGGWAGLFAPPPPAPKKAAAPSVVAKPEEATPTPAVDEMMPVDGPSPPVEEQIVPDGPSDTPEAAADETPITLTPSKDALTESNVEQLPDVSQPPASATAASTVASTVDPSSTLNTTTPAIRPGLSGYAASALKATGVSARSASFQRRVMEQHEAVVMPGNHAVDRAAVQFGSMGLNGDSEDLDVDEDREEPETRTQLPDDSPAAPRASLPPPPMQTQAPAPEYIEPQQTQRQAPGLPPVAAQHQQPTSPNISTSYADQYSRYGQNPPKAYDPFGQQPAQSQPAATQAPEPFSGQLPTTSQQTSASAPNDYSQYYGANSREAQAQAYQQYYGAAYNQNQETQQRSGSAFGSSSQDVQTQYATSRPQQPSYGQPEAQNSGHNTPNPAIQGHQAQHSGHMPQGQAGYGQYNYGYPGAYNQQYPQYGGQYGANYMGQMGGRYGSNRPAFDDVRRQANAAAEAGPEQHQTNAYNYGYNKQQYGGAGNYNQSSMYGQPGQQYSNYEHSASPANTGGFAQSAMQGRDAMYGRTGSAQPNEGQQAATGNSFGGPTPDPFGRSHSGFQGQAAQAEDPAKPSPSIAANRPGSAVNSGISGQQQQTGQNSSFPPAHSQQGGNQAFGNYPQYGNQHGTHHQAQGNHPQTAGYGGYGSNAAFSQYGGGYGSGRGWNGNQYGGTAH
jgi:hypothetical protein